MIEKVSSLIFFLRTRLLMLKKVSDIPKKLCLVTSSGKIVSTSENLRRMANLRDPPISLEVPLTKSLVNPMKSLETESWKLAGPALKVGYFRTTYVYGHFLPRGDLPKHSCTHAAYSPELHGFYCSKKRTCSFGGQKRGAHSTKRCSLSPMKSVEKMFEGDSN